MQEKDQMTDHNQTTEKLRSLIERYSGSPEFRLIDLKDVNQKGMTGDTMLHAAVIRGASEDVDILIDNGADVNAVGDLGNTPLHHAASRGFGFIAKRLLEEGANPSTRNEFGQTPADVARVMKHKELAKTLK
jgi:ankyrin repeat protein